jgi:tRNA pseudouridine32 synthase/23S rRNA pseudouridine746 synthase
VEDFVDNFIAPVCEEEIQILFRDESLLAIAKPSGLLSLSGRNPLNKDSVHWRIVKNFPTATLAHRLDLGTSGIMVLALNKRVNAHLTKQFQERTVVKRYKAMLLGHVEEEQGIIDYPIAKDNTLFPRLKICSVSGKPALTHYNVVDRLKSPSRTLVNFTPATGRTHQLRIHALAIGHPILGCDLYDDNESQGLAHRLMLHAQILEFVHPTSNKSMRFVSPCPF